MKAKYDENSDFFGSGEDVSISKYIASDIKAYLEAHELTETQAMNELAYEVNMGVRTLYRYMSGESSPSPSRLIKLYTSLFSHVSVLSDFESLVHPEVLKTMKGHPQYAFIKFKTEEISRWFEMNMLNNLTFRKIYLRAQDSTRSLPCTREWVNLLFGAYGESLLKEMLANNILKEKEGSFVVNESVTPMWSGKLIAEVTKSTINEHLKSEETSEDGKNAVGLYTKGLKEEAYLEIQRRMQRFYSEIKEFMDDENNQGNRRTFFALAMDTKDN